MNPYKVLGIRPNASKDEIERAYKNIVENDSDNYSDNPMEFSLDERLGQVNEAFSILINDIKYKEIRGLIETEQFIAAETELNLLSEKKNPEWNYLKGFVMLKKGWVQSGITHLKTAAELDPTNQEYQETIMLLTRKINAIKANYARASKANSGGGDMCGGGGGGGDMCGGGGNGQGGGIDPNLLQSLLGGMGQQQGGNPLGGNNPLAGNTGAPQGNPLQGMMGGGGGNPLQNMLMQGMMGGGGNGMNMCGGGGKGGMC